MTIYFDILSIPATAAVVVVQSIISHKWFFTLQCQLDEVTSVKLAAGVGKVRLQSHYFLREAGYPLAGLRGFPVA